jgi:hypothetical protein
MRLRPKPVRAEPSALRWAESASEHDAILAALTDPKHRDLPRILREHSQNTARKVLAALLRCQGL